MSMTMDMELRVEERKAEAEALAAQYLVQPPLQPRRSRLWLKRLVAKFRRHSGPRAEPPARPAFR